MTDAVGHFRALLRRDQVEQALEGLFNFVCEMEANTAMCGEPFPFPWLDDVCEEIGRASAFELLATIIPSVRVPHDIVLITETFVQGGHAEVIRDIADLNDRPLVIVATNLYRRGTALLPELANHERVLDVVELNQPTLLGRLRAAQALIANPAASRVLVLCHGPDSVAIAAAAPVEDKPVLYFHHCDHTPTLGGFMRNAVHVDLHNLAFQQCRAQLVNDPGYVCLTSRNARFGRTGRQHADPIFKSATCGSEGKLTKLIYPITYLDVVVRLIRARRGLHYHIGQLSDDFVAAVREALEAAGLPREAFIPVGHVAGFREIVEALEIDLYLPTLPQAGGKALIDAMAAGVPILVHENALNRLWGSRDLVYPEAWSWSHLDELEERITRFGDAEFWGEQVRASRAWFDTHHGNALFAQMLRANGRLPGHAPPPLQPYRPALTTRLRALALNTARGGGR